MNVAWYWVLVPLAPLLAALLLLLLPPQRERVTGMLWLSCVPALLLAAMPPGSAGLQELWPGNLLGASDLLSRGWLGFTATLWACAGIAATGSMREDPQRLRFWLFWLVSLSGNLLLIIAMDALTFYVGFSVMSLSAYGLIIHHGGPQPRRAGRLYLQMAIIAEILLLTGIIMRVHLAGGSSLMADWQSSTDPLMVLMLLCGAGIKAGFWPLHMWLPQAHPVAPAPASAVLSGAMLKGGILGLWRFLPGGDPALESWGLPLIGLGLFSAFYAVVVGLNRAQAKQVLAYSSVSQMGYLLIIIGLYWLRPEYEPALLMLLLLYATHHAFSKGALFLGAGMAACTMPASTRRIFWVLLAIPALAMAALPFSSGSALKILLKEGFAEDLSQWGWLLQLGSLATALLIMRAWFLLRQAAGRSPGAEEPQRPVQTSELIGLGIPALLLLLLPWLPPLRSALSSHLGPVDVFDMLWPLLGATLLALWAIRRPLHSPFSLPRRFDPLRFSLQFYRLLLWPPLPTLRAHINRARWRARERRWNRFWQGEIITRSAGMLIAFLIFAGALLALV